MSNDIIKLHSIVSDLGSKLAELSEIGRDGFNMPLVTTPDELSEMVGSPMGPWTPLSDDLLWFFALKTAIYAREILVQSNRIFSQIGDDESTQKIQTILDTTDDQFHPAETALQVYVKLLNSNVNNNGQC